MGSWRNPHKRWRPAIAWCRAKCSRCERCAHISVSLKHRDCGWYSACPVLHPFDDFRSGENLPLANASSLDPAAVARAADDAAALGDGALTEAELRAHVGELPRARPLLRELLRSSVPGFCRKTVDGDSGYCDDGDMGTSVLSTPHTPLLVIITCTTHTQPLASGCAAT